MTDRYDAIIVGARCAGSTAAIRLAGAGARVLLVDKDELPSDTLSTHTLFPNTIARLAELGALDRLVARHVLHPMRHRMRVLGREIESFYPSVDGFDAALAPRRRALDGALLDSARAAGAEVRVGERVVGLIGSGSGDEPVRGVVLDSGDRLEADLVIGADGRASTVARLLGLSRERELRGETSMLYAYWSGLPSTGRLSLESIEAGGLTRIECEDGAQLLLLTGDPSLTRGGASAREWRYRRGLRGFPATLARDELDRARMISPVRAAPETMLRGFFRRPAGPGWALVGDASHFKHPSTAQGISDAIEQALYVGDAIASGAGLDGYDAWRDDRAAGFYEWSFRLADCPSEATAGPIWDGLSRDPAAVRDLVGTYTRSVAPDAVLTRERLGRWFGAAAQAA
jgi:flavin-dependent dehydrogenase